MQLKERAGSFPLVQYPRTAAHPQITSVICSYCDARSARIVGMPEKENASLESAILQQVLDLIGAKGGDAMRQRAIDEMARQTFVGSKRVQRQELPKLAKSAASTVHRVKVSLYGAKPPIWRRLEIPSAMMLSDVHNVLQEAFGWYAGHLHQFETVCGEFSDPEYDDDWSESGDESAVALAQVAAAEKAKVVYVYDFGDDWRHDIVVERIVPAEPGVAYPRCTAGRGIPPEEDSGGIGAHNEAVSRGEPGDDFSPAALTANLAELATVIITAAK